MLGPKTEDDLKPSKGKVCKSRHCLAFLISGIIGLCTCMWPMSTSAHDVVNLLNQQSASPYT